MRHALMAGVVAVAVALTACASQPEPRVQTETVEVRVPVAMRPDPPAWLSAPAVTPDQVDQIFVAPDNPDAVLGVTRDGLEQFYLLLDGPIERLQAWRARATAGRGDVQ